MSGNDLNTSILLRLPAEIRLQIFSWLIPQRVVYVRMKWTGIRTQDGYAYACLEDTQPLRERHEYNVLSRGVPFGPELRFIGQTCRQMHREASLLPFETFIWAFETAFTLDQWVTSGDHIPAEHKMAIRTVAVPTPGPYRSSERFLVNLRDVLLVGTAYSTTTYFTEPKDMKDTDLAITILKKDKATGTWERNGERAQYAKDLFE